MKFPFVCKSSPETSSSAWPWPSCAANSRTHSFRADDTENRLSDHDDHEYDHIHEEMIISSSNPAECSIKAGLRSERLFFEPGNTNSILEEAKANNKKSVAAMEIDSRDPVLDFRVSMEEMVGAHGLKDWESLEKLLACYLRVNGKNNHGYIIGAFVDLLFSDCSSSSSSPLLSLSSSSTYSSACNLSKNDDDEKNGSCYSTCNASSSSSGV